jgi:putative transposase
LWENFPDHASVSVPRGLLRCEGFETPRNEGRRAEGANGTIKQIIQKQKNMGKTYHALWVHLVWATKYRQPLIVPSLKLPLYNKMREIAKEKNFYLDFINGIEDHVHLLVGLKPSDSIPKIVKDLKGITHTWVRDKALSDDYFHWQDGYAAISVSPDRVPTVRGYIRKQEVHHKKVNYATEWETFEAQAAIFNDCVNSSPHLDEGFIP